MLKPGFPLPSSSYRSIEVMFAMLAESRALWQSFSEEIGDVDFPTQPQQQTARRVRVTRVRSLTQATRPSNLVRPRPSCSDWHASFLERAEEPVAGTGLSRGSGKGRGPQGRCSFRAQTGRKPSRYLVCSPLAGGRKVTLFSSCRRIRDRTRFPSPSFKQAFIRCARGVPMSLWLMRGKIFKRSSHVTLLRRIHRFRTAATRGIT